MFWRLFFGRKKQEEQKQEVQQETKVPVSLPVIQEEHHDEGEKFVPLNTISVKEHTSNEKITGDMTIGDLIKKYPGSEAILMNYGIHCVGCHANPFETLAQGILGHGMSQEQLDNLVKELNEKIVTKKVKHAEHKKHKVKHVKKAKRHKK